VRLAPRSVRLRNQIVGLAKKTQSMDPVPQLTLVGFAWQPVYTFYDQPYYPGVTQVVDSLSKDRCWRAWLWSAPAQGDNSPYPSEIHILDVSGDRVYALGLRGEGALWLQPKHDISNVLRGLSGRL